MSIKVRKNPVLLIIFSLRIFFILMVSIILIPFFLIGKLLNKKSILSHKVAVIYAGIFLFVFCIRVERTYDKNFSWDGPYILLCNHLSYIDIPLILSSIPGQFRFIADKSLFNMPLVTPVMKSCGYIPVDRSRPRAVLKTLKAAANCISNGFSVLIFPEGGINHGKDKSILMDFQYGFTKIIEKEPADLLLLTLYGTDEAFKNLLNIRNNIKLHFGPVLQYKDVIKTDRKEIERIVYKNNKSIYNELSY